MGLLGRKREEKSWDDLSPVTLDMLAVEPERFNDTQVRLEGLVSGSRLTLEVLVITFFWLVRMDARL